MKLMRGHESKQKCLRADPREISLPGLANWTGREGKLTQPQCHSSQPTKHAFKLNFVLTFNPATLEAKKNSLITRKNLRKETLDDI
jgi:hypothetical protein